MASVLGVLLLRLRWSTKFGTVLTDRFSRQRGTLIESPLNQIEVYAHEMKFRFSCGQTYLVASVALFVAISTAPVIAEEYYEKGVRAYSEGRFEQAIITLQPLIERGHPGAELMLGVMFLRGEGRVQDEGVAAVWLFKAARKGEAGAQLILGTQYLYGRGVERDTSKAYLWLGLAAESTITDVAKQAIVYRDEAALKMAVAEVEKTLADIKNWKPTLDGFVPATEN
jgi:hypothetical protein